jgi:hypothetical protein
MFSRIIPAFQAFKPRSACGDKIIEAKKVIVLEGKPKGVTFF